MPESLTLTNLLDDAAILSLEHQLHLEEVLGEHNWSVDLREQRFEFTGSRTITCTRFHLLGSAAPGPESWLWAWANPSGFPEPLTALSGTLRDFGQQFGIAELASAEVPFAALPTSPAEPPFAAAILTEAAKAVTGSRSRAPASRRPSTSTSTAASATSARPCRHPAAPEKRHP